MKIIFPLFIAAALSLGCSKQPAPPPAAATDHAARVAVETVRQAFNLAITNAFTLVAPDKAENFNAVMKGTKAEPHKLFSIGKLAENMRQVPVAGCPEDFRMAWIDFIHEIENYKADTGKGQAGAVMWGAVAVKTGSKSAADQAAKDAANIHNGDTVRAARQRLEDAFVKYEGN